MKVLVVCEESQTVRRRFKISIFQFIMFIIFFFLLGYYILKYNSIFELEKIRELYPHSIFIISMYSIFLCQIFEFFLGLFWDFYYFIRIKKISKKTVGT